DTVEPAGPPPMTTTRGPVVSDMRDLFGIPKAIEHIVRLCRPPANAKRQAKQRWTGRCLSWWGRGHKPNTGWGQPKYAACEGPMVQIVQWTRDDSPDTLALAGQHLWAGDLVGVPTDSAY